MTDQQMARIVPGSVLLSPSGRARTVVAVHRTKGRIAVTVPILHCSWTHRPYTVLDRQLLLAYRLTRLKVQFKRKKLGRLVLKDSEGSERFCDCCDVIGKFE